MDSKMGDTNDTNYQEPTTAIITSQETEIHGRTHTVTIVHLYTPYV